ncbi:MAG: acylphosphatase [Elusimicrobia bacterium]|nr:acylphosphatase [Elusimicrobiota bacterium]
MAEKRARLIVRGVVQGIGYRYFAQKMAKQSNLQGWVKNQPDGSVELAVEGDESDIERLIASLKQKHPWAKVDAVEIEWQPYAGEFQTFEITY